jgi:hypothetical protein
MKWLWATGKEKKKCTKCNCDNEGPILVDICRKNLMVNSCLIQTKKTLERTQLYLTIFVGLYGFAAKTRSPSTPTTLASEFFIGDLCTLRWLEG